jgi:cell division protein FtsB
MRTAFRLDDVPVHRDSRQREETIFRASSGVVLCVVVVLVFWSMIGDGGLVVRHNQGDEAKALRERIAQEQSRSQLLLARVELLKSESFELERVAREELGLVREGEIVFDFRPPGIR